MENENTSFLTPSGYQLRLGDADDVALLRDVVQTCSAHQQLPSPPLVDAVLELADPSVMQGNTVCALDEARQIVAFAHVSVPEHRPHEYRTVISGCVHPQHRRRGLGNALLSWSEARARELLASLPPDRFHIMRIDTDAVTDAAAALYMRHGFPLDFAEDEMHRRLDQPLPQIQQLLNMQYLPWSPQHASHFFAAYEAAFRERPGFPGWSKAEWSTAFSGSVTFRPDLSFVAMREGEAVGFIMCDVDAADTLPVDQRAGWIDQVGVRPTARGRGLADALITMVLQRFRTEGLPYAKLFVNVNNPRAARVYARLGFVMAQRRSVYQKRVEPVSEPLSSMSAQR